MDRSQFSSQADNDAKALFKVAKELGKTHLSTTMIKLIAPFFLCSSMIFYNNGEMPLSCLQKFPPQNDDIKGTY